MRKLILFFLFPVVSGNTIAQQNCEDKQHPPSVFTDSLQKIFDESLASSYSKYQNDSTNAEHIVWYGRRTAYLGNYKEAIDIYTRGDRKSTRLNSSHSQISYAVFCLKKKNKS